MVDMKQILKIKNKNVIGSARLVYCDKIMQIRLKGKFLK